MKSIGSNTGFSGLALIALIMGVAACGSTTTVYKTVPGSDTPGETTPPEETTPDPSTQGDPTSKDTPAPPLVNGLAITDVAFFQGVKTNVITDGKAVPKASRNAPVV